MSCRCITPFSLLNAYTELIGRSSVSIVSLFKHGKGYRWLVVCVLPWIQGMKPTLELPLLHGMQILTQALQTTCSYTEKSRFTSVTAATAISFLWALLDQAAQHYLVVFWDFLSALLTLLMLCPAVLPASPVPHLHSPFNAMHIFNVFWKGNWGAQQELTLLETYTLCKESRVM